LQVTPPAPDRAPARLAQAKPEPRIPDQPAAALPAAEPAAPVAQRRETIPAEPPAARPQTAKAEPQRPPVPDTARTEVSLPEPPRPEPRRVESARKENDSPDNGKSDPARFDTAKTEQPKAPQRVAMVKPVPAPPPPPPPLQDPDDAQSVLARLRQFAPGGSPPRQAATASAAGTTAADPKTRLSSAPTLPELNAARAALAGGRIGDARRLLQQAQLQLVFRPVSSAGDDSPAAAKGAADVARALDALSANDAPLSRRYIDIAAGDLSGTATNPPIQETQIRSTGYAPAYPPR
jgi:hypothetical protein